jgi:signal transduction histidine kinase
MRLASALPAPRRAAQHQRLDLDREGVVDAGEHHVGAAAGQFEHAVQRILHDVAVNFSANAAHELRTPIAAALAQGQLLAARLPPGHAERDQAEAMVEGLRQLARRIEKLLQLARAEAGVALRLEPVDLLVPLHLVTSFAADPVMSSLPASRAAIALAVEGRGP